MYMCVVQHVNDEPCWCVFCAFFLQLYGFSMISEFGLGPTVGKRRISSLVWVSVTYPVVVLRSEEMSIMYWSSWPVCVLRHAAGVRMPRQRAVLPHHNGSVCWFGEHLNLSFQKHSYVLNLIPALFWPLTLGDPQEPERQRQSVVYRHRHHRWHRISRSVPRITDT